MSKKKSNLKIRMGWIGILMLPSAFVLYTLLNFIFGFAGLSDGSSNTTTGLGEQLLSILNILIMIAATLGFIGLPVGIVLLLVGKSELKKRADQKPSSAKTQEFYSLSSARLITYTVLTFGLFEIYWFYKNWQAVAVHDRKVQYPFARSIFSVFYVHSLFRSIYVGLNRNGGKSRDKAGVLAWMYIVPALISNVIFRVESSDWSLWLIGFAVELIALIPVIIVNQSINDLVPARTLEGESQGPDHKRTAIEAAFMKRYKIAFMSDDAYNSLDAEKKDELYAEGLKLADMQKQPPRESNAVNDELARTKLSLVRIGFKKINNIDVADTDLEQLPQKALDRYYQVGVSELNKK
jgi:hypothetical protein